MYQITGLVNYDSTNGTHTAAQDETGANTQQNMALATNLQTVNMGEEATVTFMNEKSLTGSVRLKKTTTSDTILPGAVFQAFEQLGAAPDKANDRFLGEKTVGADGFITLTERAAGTYYFIETIAPTGYILDSTIHTVTLTVEDITAQNNDPADESLIPTVTVQNQKKASSLGALKITKTIDTRYEAFGDPSFIFEITGDPADENTKGLKFTRMITMDGAKLYGYAVINDLPLGKYKVREINVSRYHLIDENPISVTYGTAGAIVTADATAEVTLAETPNAENVNGIVNYSNTFEQYEKFSHTSAVTNHVGGGEPEIPEPDVPHVHNGNGYHHVTYRIGELTMIMHGESQIMEPVVWPEKSVVFCYRDNVLQSVTWNGMTQAEFDAVDKWYFSNDKTTEYTGDPSDISGVDAAMISTDTDENDEEIPCLELVQWETPNLRQITMRIYGERLNDADGRETEEIGTAEVRLRNDGYLELVTASDVSHDNKLKYSMFVDADDNPRGRRFREDETFELEGGIYGMLTDYILYDISDWSKLRYGYNMIAPARIRGFYADAEDRNGQMYFSGPVDTFRGYGDFMFADDNEIHVIFTTIDRDHLDDYSQYYED